MPEEKIDHEQEQFKSCGICLEMYAVHIQLGRAKMANDTAEINLCHDQINEFIRQLKENLTA